MFIKNLFPLSVLISVSLLFAACVPEVTPPRSPNAMLVGTWNNYRNNSNITENDKKDFSVTSNRFTCHINPGKDGKDYQGWGTVTGQLDYIDTTTYRMYDLHGEPDKPGTAGWTADNLLNVYNGAYLSIVFDGDNIFDFTSADVPPNTEVTTFFGGEYYRVD